ncbi:hypothetical protein QQ045_027753 [Rhodiola kirilowii]
MYSSQLPLARTCAAFSSNDARASPETGQLEDSLLRLVHEHNQSSHKLCDFTEKAKKNAIKSAGRVSELLVDKVNGEVQEAFVNEKRIELEIRALTETICRFGKQTDQWLAASHTITTAIKVAMTSLSWSMSCNSVAMLYFFFFSL